MRMNMKRRESRDRGKWNKNTEGMRGEENVNYEDKEERKRRGCVIGTRRGEEEDVEGEKKRKEERMQEERRGRRGECRGI